MIKIAICDDDMSELSNITSIIKEYKKTNSFMYEITYIKFHSAIELIASIEGGKRYDIILLDIIMPQINGLEAAEEIRLHDKITKIVFLTSSPEFAVDSYKVDAYYYALKPIQQEKMFFIMDKLLSEIQKQTQDCILVKCKTGLTRIPLHTLEYVEIIERIIHYHLVNGSILKETGVMINLERILLSFPQFAKTHRSFIVNLDRINILGLRELTCYSNAIIPISKTNYKNLKQKYMERTFKKAEDEVCL